MNRVTKLDLFANIYEHLTATNADPMLVECMAHEIDLLQKRKEAPKKPTTTQLENKETKKKITLYLYNNPGGYTATAIAKTVHISTQKATALLHQLISEQVLFKTPPLNKIPTRFHSIDTYEDDED